jgi:ribosomal protein S18 acetylase RimI-like enzyme
VAQDLDLAAFQRLIHRAGRARTHQAFDLDAKLVAQAFGGFEHLRAVWVADDLHIAFAVAQIHKNHAAMVAAAVDPTAQGNGLA